MSTMLAVLSYKIGFPKVMPLRVREALHKVAIMSVLSNYYFPSYGLKSLEVFLIIFITFLILGEAVEYSR